MSEALSNYSFTEERLDGLVVEGQEGTRVTMIIHREPYDPGQVSESCTGPEDPWLAPIMLVDGEDVALTAGEATTQHAAQLTLLELKWLCKHWFEELQKVDQVWSGHSREIRIQIYAATRVAYFQRLLGVEEVGEAIDGTFRNWDEHPRDYAASVSMFELKRLQQHWLSEHDFAEQLLEEYGLDCIELLRRAIYTVEQIEYLRQFVDPDELREPVESYETVEDPLLW